MKKRKICVRAWWLIAALLVGLIPEKSWGQDEPVNVNSFLQDPLCTNNYVRYWTRDGANKSAFYVVKNDALKSDDYDFNQGIEFWTEAPISEEKDLIYQNVIVPNGKYTLTGYAMARVTDTNKNITGGIFFFANNAESDVKTDVWGKHSVEVEVTDNNLRIGLRAKADNKNNWLAIANVTLLFQGSELDYLKALTLLRIDDYKEELLSVTNANEETRNTFTASLATIQSNISNAEAEETVKAAFSEFITACQTLYMDGGGISSSATEFDVTPLFIKNAWFDAGSDGWTGCENDYVSNGYYNRSKNFTGRIFQTVTVPNGVYRLSVQEHANKGDKVNLYLSSSHATSAVKMNWNVNDVTQWVNNPFSNKSYATTGTVLVIDKQAEVGVDIHTGNDGQNLFFDNFKLVYVSNGLAEVKALYEGLYNNLNTAVSSDTYPIELNKRADELLKATVEETTDAYAVAYNNMTALYALFNVQAKEIRTLQDKLNGYYADESANGRDDLGTALSTASTSLETVATNEGLATIYAGLIAAEKTFDWANGISFVVETFNFNDGKYDGWASNDFINPSYKGGPGIGSGALEFWYRKYDFWREITGLKNGWYQIRMNGFYRNQPRGSYDKAHYAQNPTRFVASTWHDLRNDRYDTEYKMPICPLYSENCTGLDNLSDGGRYPAWMNEASEAFQAGKYENVVNVLVENGKMVYGIKDETVSRDCWTCFDNISLVFMGYDYNAMYNTMAERALEDAAEVSEAYKNSMQSIVNNNQVAKGASYADAMEGIKKLQNAMNNTTDLKNLKARFINLIEMSESDYENSDAVNKVTLQDAITKAKDVYNSLSDVTTGGNAYSTLSEVRNSYVMDANPHYGYLFDMNFLLTNPDLTGFNTWTGTDGWYSDLTSGNRQVMWNTAVAGESGTRDYFYEAYEGGGLSNIDVVYQKAELPAGNYKMTAYAFGNGTMKGYLFADATQGTSITSGKLSPGEVYFDLDAKKECKLGLHVADATRTSWTGVGYMNLYKLATDVILNENNESCVLEEGSTPYNITLTRTLKADKWNTFCVPFDMNDEQLSANNITEVRKLTSAKEGNVLTFNKVTTVEAGVPYIVKVSEEVSTIKVNNTTIKAAAPSTVEVSYDVAEVSTGNKVAMTGNYTKQYVPKDAYFISNNMFYLADQADAVTLKGFRAYITATKGTAVSEGVEANCFFIDIDGVVTAASEVLADKEALQDVVDVYTMTGVKVRSNVQRAGALNGLAKGLYIVGGKTVINNE